MRWKAFEELLDEFLVFKKRDIYVQVCQSVLLHDVLHIENLYAANKCAQRKDLAVLLLCVGPIEEPLGVHQKKTNLNNRSNIILLVSYSLIIVKPYPLT